MRYENIKVRKMMAKYGITGRDLSNKIGISNVTLSHWLGSELSVDREERISKAIEELRRK